jgi:hypothetical protein
MSGTGATVKVLRSVSYAQLMGKPLRNCLTRLMILAHADVAKPGHVPIDQGYLRGGLAPGAGVTQVDGDNPPKWAVVGTNAVQAARLEYDPAMHYRDGPSSGGQTLGWLSNTLGHIEGDVGGVVRQLAGDIAKEWDG